MKEQITKDDLIQFGRMLVNEISTIVKGDDKREKDILILNGLKAEGQGNYWIFPPDRSRTFVLPARYAIKKLWARTIIIRPTF